MSALFLCPTQMHLVVPCHPPPSGQKPDLRRAHASPRPITPPPTHRPLAAFLAPLCPVHRPRLRLRSVGCRPAYSARFGWGSLTPSGQATRSRFPECDHTARHVWLHPFRARMAHPHVRPFLSVFCLFVQPPFFPLFIQFFFFLKQIRKNRYGPRLDKTRTAQPQPYAIAFRDNVVEHGAGLRPDNPSARRACVQAKNPDAPGMLQSGPSPARHAANPSRMA